MTSPAHPPPPPFPPPPPPLPLALHITTLGFLTRAVRERGKWINSNIIKKINERDHLHSKAIKSNDPLHRNELWSRYRLLKELGTSRTHSAVIRCLTICQRIPVVRKNHKNQLTQQFDIICCLAQCLALCIERKTDYVTVELRIGDPKTRSATLRSALRTVSSTLT